MREDILVTKDGKVFIRGEPAKLKLNNSGYLRVTYKKGERYLVHLLVALKYVPNPHNKPCVNHIDGDKLNNNYKNLEWVTHSENTKHAYRLGLEKPNLQLKVKQRCKRRIRRILRLRAKGYSVISISKKFGYTRQHTSRLINQYKKDKYYEDIYQFI